MRARVSNLSKNTGVNKNKRSFSRESRRFPVVLNGSEARRGVSGNSSRREEHRELPGCFLWLPVPLASLYLLSFVDVRRICGTADDATAL